MARPIATVKIIGSPTGEGAEQKTKEKKNGGQDGSAQKNFKMGVDDTNPRKGPQYVGCLEARAEGHGERGEGEIRERVKVRGRGGSEGEGGEKKNASEGVVANTACL